MLLNTIQVLRRRLPKATTYLLLSKSQKHRCVVAIADQSILAEKQAKFKEGELRSPRYPSPP